MVRLKFCRIVVFRKLTCWYLDRKDASLDVERTKNALVTTPVKFDKVYYVEVKPGQSRKYCHSLSHQISGYFRVSIQRPPAPLPLQARRNRRSAWRGTSSSRTRRHDLKLTCHTNVEVGIDFKSSTLSLQHTTQIERGSRITPILDPSRFNRES